MNRYEEDQLDPPDIEDEEFYCRYTLEYKSRKVDVNIFLLVILFPVFLTNFYSSPNKSARAFVQNHITQMTCQKIT